MTQSDPAALPAALAGAASRLALRQQNLAVLMPVLLHDVNGSLNGLALSTELLSRLQQRGAADPASAANLLLRTRNELGRLKLALKALENRVAPGGLVGEAPVREAPLIATLHEVQTVLLPAIRRGQHELRPAVHEGELAIDARPDELFDLLAGLAIVMMEGAPPRTTLDSRIEASEESATVIIDHEGRARSGISLEIHRELLRSTAAHASGAVEWHQSGAGSRARLRLPLAAARRGG
jgi:hypothetical protein